MRHAGQADVEWDFPAPGIARVTVMQRFPIDGIESALEDYPPEVIAHFRAAYLSHRHEADKNAGEDGDTCDAAILFGGLGR